MSEASFERFEIGRVLNNTFGLIIRNFIAFFLLGLVFAGVPQFGALLAQSWEGLRAAPMAAAWTPLATALVSMVCMLILQGAVTRAAVDDLSARASRSCGRSRRAFRTSCR